ncbi:recombinase family protein [Streptomyces sp. NPDC001351]|uniref:recombinase family protein n=1 Tax=Streptomyces sp. NPDC001351 TaxID=3364564 RepID=UPI0036C2D5B6
MPDPGPAKIVQEIFQRVSAGESARTISGDLNARGIPGPSGGAWQHAALVSCQPLRWCPAVPAEPADDRQRGVPAEPSPRSRSPWP